MKRESVLLYKLLSNIEFECGNISLHDYKLRLLTLYNLSNSSKEILSNVIDLIGNEYITEIIYEEFLTSTESETNSNQISETIPQSYDDPLQFLTSKPGIFSKWQFKVSDPDFFPSIPHGHSTKNNNIKLDSYLGYLYDVSYTKTKALPIGRESRSYIIDLWNDDNFRALAIKSIDWYLDSNPSYIWRIPRSRVKFLPKKRKNSQ